jgi:hypothetical protein
MKILFMMTEPRVLKYYHDTLRYLLKEGHSVHVAYFSLEKHRGGTLHEEKEAVDLHGADAERIVVTGAPYFDAWFVRSPSRNREDFCRTVGLPPDRPILMYMCSSNFMAPNERAFVLKWIGSIRSSGIPGLSEAGFLIRPYPEYDDQWQSVDFSPYGDIVVWPPDGEYAITKSAKRNFYDSVYHSIAVVGVNITAIIESAIIGRCGLSVLASEFNESQSNTIHFSYLKQENGGFLYLAKDLDEHIAQLQVVLRNSDRMSRQIAQFVAHFAQPHGIQQPASSSSRAPLRACGRRLPHPPDIPLNAAFVIRAGSRCARIQSGPASGAHEEPARQT